MFKLKYSYSTKDAAALPLIIVAVSIVYSFLFSFVVTKIAMGAGCTTADEVAAYAALPWVNVINMFLGQAFTVGAFFVYSAYNGKKTFEATTIKGKFRLFPILIVMAITAVCIFGFNYLIALVDYSIFSLTDISQDGVAVPQSVIGYIIVVVVFAVVPAIVEEFIYRGVVFNGLRKTFKPWVSIVLSALIFTLAHFNVYQTVYQFIMGIIMATICYFTGSIIYSMIFHLMNNFLVVTLSYFVPKLFVVGDMSALVIFLIILGALVASGIIVGLFFLLSKLVKKTPTAAAIVEEKTEKEQMLQSSEGLSEYDIKQLNPPTLSNKGWTILTIVVFVALWIITNFV